MQDIQQIILALLATLRTSLPNEFDAPASVTDARASWNYFTLRMRIQRPRWRAVLFFVCGLILTSGCTTLTGEYQDPTALTGKSADPNIAANKEAEQKFDVWQTSHNEAVAAGLNPVWNGAQAVRLTYRIDAGQLGTPLAISCVQGQQVSYQEVAPSPLSQRSVGVLDIQYPHPAGREGMALVGVVIQQQEHGNRGFTPNFLQHALGWFGTPDEDTIVGSNRDMHEAWVMDVPRHQLDKLVGQLQAAGFYGEAEQRRGHVRVTSRMGASYIVKDWSNISAFDELMHRVRSQGQLVSYQGIAMPLERRPSAPASIAAWRALQDAGQTTGEPATQLAGQGGQPATGTLFSAPHQPQQAALPVPQIAQAPDGSTFR